MKLIVNKDRLLELIDDPDAGLKAHKLLAYTFSEDVNVFKKVLSLLYKEVQQGDLASVEVLIITNLLRNYIPTTSDIPLLLDILREVQKHSDEPKLYFAGIFSVISLALKLDFNELKENKSLFGDDEVGINVLQYIEWIEENRNGNAEELGEELISVTRKLTEEVAKEEQNVDQEVFEELQEQIMDFKHLLITKKDSYSSIVESSLKELMDTDNYILQDFSIEMAGIWKSANTIIPLVEIARIAEPELSVYQKTIDALSFLQSEEIFSHAEEMFRFQEDARVSFAEILGHYPYDKSEEILIKYLYKEKDRDIVTLCAWGLSNIFSLKAADAIKEVADKGKINSEMITLNEILLPIYIYHRLPVPDWMRIESHHHH
ncbi:MAG: hypothetical protein IPG24_23005 [Leptospiraceae bacterium]|nr:hypothetical protein [Leptospiraceae bacterium]